MGRRSMRWLHSRYLKMTLSDQLEETTITTPDDEVVYCTVHPNAETALRCNRCGRPMCTRCAVRTPVGYRCKECVREQQDKFFDAQMIDYLIAAGVSLVASFFAALIFPGGFQFGPNIVLANWVLFTVALWLLAVLEDRELAAHFGAEYEEYAQRIPRLFPN